jgi:hypothetical protein
MAPKMPKEIQAPSNSLYPVNQFNSDVNDYRAAVKTGTKESLATAQLLRNQMAYRVMADIESNYGHFEMKLSSGRAIQATLADATSLGLTAATSVVGATDVKDILAVTGTAFQGTWTSYDKNFFQQKTTEAIIAQMRATRQNKQAQLIASLANRDVTSYPWEAVWIDLVDFFYAGTVPSALVDIASSSGEQAKAATSTLNAVINQQAKMAIGARAAYMKLQTEISAPQKVASAVTALRTILTAAGYQPPTNATPSDLLALFRKALADADPDVDKNGEKLKALNAAVSAANLN